MESGLHFRLAIGTTDLRILYRFLISDYTRVNISRIHDIATEHVGTAWVH